MKSFTAKKNEQDLRLWRFCEKLCPAMPKGLLHKAFRNKRIKVNGKKQDENYRIQENDLIELYINDEFFVSSNSPAKKEITDYSSLKIVYEDNNLLVVNKPFGLLCHSDNKDESNLIDMAIAYLIEKGEYSPDKEFTFTPALCNRIDQGTEGLVIIGKNYQSVVAMNRAIKDNLTQKTYVCVTQNKVNDGTYSAFLKRNLSTKKVTVYPDNVPESKKIITEFRTIADKNGYYLIECHLITGRTHQIRAHLSFLKSPIIGDKKYGKAYKNLDSQMLCAYKLKIHKLPEDSYLSYLSNREFCIEDNSVSKFWDKL